MTLAATFPIKRICRVLGINRSGFYKWKHRLEHPSQKLLDFADNLQLFKEYHVKYPSHGYRWLNAKIRLDTGKVMSDQYAHKCCKTVGIVSKSKHYRWRKPRNPGRIYPNLLLQGINIDGPLQCIVSDMTPFLFPEGLSRAYAVCGPFQQRNRGPCVVSKERRSYDLH